MLICEEFVARLWRVFRDKFGWKSMGRATFNISMPASMREYVEKRVNGGRFGSVSEYFRDLVRKDQFWVQEELRERVAAERQRAANSDPWSAINHPPRGSFRRGRE